MTTSDQTTQAGDQTTTAPGGGGDPQATPGIPQTAPQAPPPAQTTAQDPTGESGAVDPTASPGPTQQSTDTRPSDAPMPGTGPTQDVTAQAVDTPADPNEDAVLIDAGSRGLTFRRSDDNGGGLVTLEVRLRGGSLTVGPFDDDDGNA